MSNTLISERSSRYTGKVIESFEDSYGNSIDSLEMCEDVVIVFSDGSKLRLSQDWRGSECYISQREVE